MRRFITTVSPGPAISFVECTPRGISVDASGSFVAVKSGAWVFGRLSQHRLIDALLRANPGELRTNVLRTVFMRRKTVRSQRRKDTWRTLQSRVFPTTNDNHNSELVVKKQQLESLRYIKFSTPCALYRIYRFISYSYCDWGQGERRTCLPSR